MINVLFNVLFNLVICFERELFGGDRNYLLRSARKKFVSSIEDTNLGPNQVFSFHDYLVLQSVESSIVQTVDYIP